MEKPITEAGILEAYLIPWSRRLLKISRHSLLLRQS